jgi:hypothetical protein
MRKTVLFLTLLTLISWIGNAQAFTEILGRPTDTSMTASILFNTATDLYLEYGTSSGVYTQSTTQTTAIGGTPLVIDMQNLVPNTKYYWRTRYRSSGPGTFLSGSEHTFYTQRAPGSTFTFTIESDVHLYDKKGCTNLYKICLANQAADKPDFMIDMGDTYGDDHKPALMTSSKSDSLHRVYRPILGTVCHSIPYYFCLGNHEGEMDYYLLQNPPNNIAAWGTIWRKFYFPGPSPNAFYTGNTDIEPNGLGNPENFYAWTWGDALFVVLDVYRYQCDTSAKPQKWDWTLGYDQYSWLKSTLENSTATYKFVFAHQLRGQGRGGVADARFYEWGGYTNATNYQFSTYRPSPWTVPIHQLFVDNNVDVFFHGHDHVFAHESLDGVVYQELPMPSDSTYEIGMLANADAYVSDTLDGSGHLRVTVSPSCVVIDYVRAYLPIDTLSGLHHNREVAFSYTVGNCPTTTADPYDQEVRLQIYPNPAADLLNIVLPGDLQGNNIQYNLINTLGQTVLTSKTPRLQLSSIPQGMYIVNIVSENFSFNKQIMISH